MSGTAPKTVIDRLGTFPRIDLGVFPTPVEEMPRLRAALGSRSPRIFIKRDDYSGFGFGGNKVRTLEYVIGKLKSDGVEAVVAVGGDRSNHARVTAFACVRAGMRCFLVLDRKPRPVAAANLMTATIHLSKILGAEVQVVESISERAAKADSIVQELSEGGISVRLMPLGGATPEGALGFVGAMNELACQRSDLGVKFSRIHFASSGAGTHTGILVGSRLFGFQATHIRGISPEPGVEEARAEIERFAAETESILGLGRSQYDIDFDDKYAGPGYCEETPAATEAINLVARAEGILLDPVYTGKAMAALVDSIRRGEIGADENVLFWHTGGQLTIFYTEGT